MNHRVTIYIIVLLAALSGCNKDVGKKVMFEALNKDRTGLKFSNDLAYNKAFNLFKYMYFYNGSGVGAGDFNNDGKIDLYFGSNQHQNTLYLNEGALHFKDKTKEAGIPDDGGWTTGISVVDINNDGLLDIYVCRVGNYEILKSKNQLLVCTGIDKNGTPHYTDEAAKYGLDFSGFSTQAVFFDYDGDGDLDMFLLNHSVHENGTFRPRKDFAGTQNLLAGDRIYRNDSGKFTDITKVTGIESTAIGYGLGITVADINLDGYPDIYIGNDFHEDDYLYINQKNGTFKQESEERLMHTSQFSMGVDVADINNDAYPEIISLDMLPSDPYILKRSLGEDAYDIFRYKVSAGYSHQYARNALQYNRRNGMFSETGLYSGVAATDWSWAPLFFDFDNDGLKDLFISNGIPKRMNDIDYVNYISNGDIQGKIKSDNMEDKDMTLIDKFPQIKIPNKFFHNNGDMTFSDEKDYIKGDQPTFSNGTIYADLDNDGDLDVVVNNIDQQVILYENKTADQQMNHYCRVKLKGPSNNINAIGTKIVLFQKDSIRTYEKFPVRGFLSSMETPMLIGMTDKKMDSAFLIWPDNTYQRIEPGKPDTTISFVYKKGLPVFNYTTITSFYKDTSYSLEDITNQVNLEYVHQENDFNEFNREPLIPQMLSTEGPAVAVADINHDHLEDIYIGGARNKPKVLFIQQPDGRFKKSITPQLSQDSIYEDVSAVWADVNNDGNPDLIVGSGGNEFYGQDFHNSPRVYLNDGKGNLSRKMDAFTGLYITASVVVAYDFNNDGYTDLFIGGRAVPYEYGKMPQSYILLNDKTGRFKDATEQIAPGLANVGMATNATLADINNDKRTDLILSLQWGAVTAFINKGNKFVKQELSTDKGWWNFVTACDIDGDGKMDIVAGNLGLNSRLKASTQQPVSMYYADFDNNGKSEQVLTYYLNGREIPFANMAELQKQLPMLKKEFLYAGDFAKANLDDLFGKSKLDKAQKWQADYFASAVFINKGNMQFEVKPFPFETQLSTMKSAVIVNANKDKLPDILMMGNFEENNIQMGRYDADFGTVLINKGAANFNAQSLNGLVIKKQVRHIVPLTVKDKLCYLLACNNDTSKIIRFNKLGCVL